MPQLLFMLQLPLSGAERYLAACRKQPGGVELRRIMPNMPKTKPLGEHNKRALEQGSFIGK
jgi:hypothetical protein